MDTGGAAIEQFTYLLPGIRDTDRVDCFAAAFVVGLPLVLWLLLRSGWSRHGQDPEAFLNGGVTPGVHPLCAQWLAEQTAIQGLGVETVGTDAGQAGGFEPAYPCHWFFHGANKYGLTQLRHLAELPARGALLIVAPLPIVGGSGSPCRVIAIFEKEAP